MCAPQTRYDGKERLVKPLVLIQCDHLIRRCRRVCHFDLRNKDFSVCAKNKDSSQVIQAGGHIPSVLGPGGQPEGIKCSVTRSRRTTPG